MPYSKNAEREGWPTTLMLEKVLGMLQPIGSVPKITNAPFCWLETAVEIVTPHEEVLYSVPLPVQSLVSSWALIEYRKQNDRMREHPIFDGFFGTQKYMAYWYIAL